MEEAEVDSVSEQVAPDEAVTHDSEQEERQPEPDPQERNWRAVRQKMNDMEKELKSAQQQRDELLQKILESQKMPEPEEDPLDPEDYASYGGVQKVTKKALEPMEKKIQELEAQLQAKRQQELIEGLRRQYTDFDDVVNPETIALFEEKEPELATTIAEIKDPYKMGIMAYKNIKACGIVESVPGKRRAKETARAIEKSEEAIQSPQAYEKRPMAQAYKMTEADQSKLYEEMTHYASLVSAVPPM